MLKLDDLVFKTNASRKSTISCGKARFPKLYTSETYDFSDVVRMLNPTTKTAVATKLRASRRGPETTLVRETRKTNKQGLFRGRHAGAPCAFPSLFRRRRNSETSQQTGHDLVTRARGHESSSALLCKLTDHH